MSKLTTIPFGADTLFAVERSDGIFVAIKPIADRLGVDWSSQHRRLSRDPILAEGMAVMTIPSAGGDQETTVLRLELLNGWLFGIDAARVRPECRDAVQAYRRECFAVLHGHFYGRRQEGGCIMHPPLPSPAREEPVAVRRGLVTEARQTFGARAAGALWFNLGLPVVPEMHGAEQPNLFTYTAIRHDAPAQREGR